MQIYLIFDLANVNGKYSPWDWDQNGIKQEAEHITSQNLANVMYKNNIHANRLESVVFGM